MILDRIVAAKQAARRRREPIALDDLVAQAEALPRARDFRRAVAPRGRGLNVIAEFKRGSPSGGAIRPDGDPAAVAAEYERAGASALSVLTDAEFFGAAPDDLARARAAAALPVLKKDFLLDERDLVDARLAGADAALLIVRIIDPDHLAPMIKFAHVVGLHVLVEAHTEREIIRALAAGAEIIGVNHRDLDTLAIDLGLSARARELIGPERLLVAESGLKTREDLDRMRAHGADAVLIGESLLRAPSPGAALAELLG